MKKDIKNHEAPPFAHPGAGMEGATVKVGVNRKMRRRAEAMKRKGQTPKPKRR